MDFWNIHVLQKLKKCKNLTKSALGGVRCLNSLMNVINWIIFSFFCSDIIIFTCQKCKTFMIYNNEDKKLLL